MTPIIFQGVIVMHNDIRSFNWHSLSKQLQL